jgi:hypothetical protein
MKGAIDMNGKKVRRKMLINIQTKMNLKKRIEPNMKIAMNMNVKVNTNETMIESEFKREFHGECEEECQDEAESDAANGNEMPLNCLVPGNQIGAAGAPGGWHLTRLLKISRAKRTTCHFGSDSCRYSLTG